MYESLRFKGTPLSPCSRNPLHSFIPVVSVNLQEGKKINKFEFQKHIKSSL